MKSGRHRDGICFCSERVSRIWVWTVAYISLVTSGNCVSDRGCTSVVVCFSPTTLTFWIRSPFFQLLLYGSPISFKPLATTEWPDLFYFLPFVVTPLFCLSLPISCSNSLKMSVRSTYHFGCKSLTFSTTFMMEWTWHQLKLWVGTTSHPREVFSTKFNPLKQMVTFSVCFLTRSSLENWKVRFWRKQNRKFARYSSSAQL